MICSSTLLHTEEEEAEWKIERDLETWFCALVPPTERRERERERERKRERERGGGGGGAVSTYMSAAADRREADGRREGVAARMTLGKLHTAQII